MSLWQQYKEAAATLFSQAEMLESPAVDAIRIRGTLVKPLIVCTSATCNRNFVEVNPLTKASMVYPAIEFQRLPKNGDTELDLFIDLRGFAAGVLDYTDIIYQLTNFCRQVAAHGIHLYRP